MIILFLTIYATGLTLAKALWTQGAQRIRFNAGVFAVFVGIVFWIDSSPLLAFEPQSIRSALNEFYLDDKPRSFSIEMADMAKVNMHKPKGAEAFFRSGRLMHVSSRRQT